MSCHAKNYSQICIPFIPYIVLILPILQIMSSPALCTNVYKCLFSYSLGDQCFQPMITNVFIFIFFAALVSSPLHTWLQMFSFVPCTYEHICLFFFQPWGLVVCVSVNKCFYFLQLLLPNVDANDNKKMFFAFFSLQRYPVWFDTYNGTCVMDGILRWCIIIFFLLTLI